MFTRVFAFQVSINSIPSVSPDFDAPARSSNKHYDLVMSEAELQENIRREMFCL